ncbi:hypothetical protein Kpho02_44240 [Kitasatospora phosalacinea]|uniref:Uncharacterized protein n=1 Tax=Kitasatospora phosalacinea TaxID=2065 RepID=A0A9W6V4J0_9ACTN|nr:hypothetical protein Kpho02_44240 [Kitasatospora phosalacinea]
MPPVVRVSARQPARAVTARAQDRTGRAVTGPPSHRGAPVRRWRAVPSGFRKHCLGPGAVRVP